MVRKAPKNTQGGGSGRSTMRSYLVSEGLDRAPVSPKGDGDNGIPGTPVKNKGQTEGGTPGKEKEKSKDQSPAVKGQSKVLKTPESQQIQSSMFTDTSLGDAQAPPTRQDMMDMSEMILRLERTIKGEMGATRRDIQSVLQRVEGIEEQLEEHRNAITELRDRADMDWIEIRNARYKLEDQENRSRRKNLRIKGLPEEVKDTELGEVLRGIFNTALKREATAPMHFERVHRIQKFYNTQRDLPRDIIVRFLEYNQKELVSQTTRNSAIMEYKGIKLLLFSDLSAETLARKRALKPLTSHLQSKDIPYRWGFPACLSVKNMGISAVIRFPEDVKEFCKKLNIQPMQIDNWEKRPPAWRRWREQEWNRA